MSGVHFDKLNEHNYPTWSIQMRSLLVHADLWGIVCGRELKEESSTSTVTEAFDSKNEKALASIVLAVHPTQLNHIKNCETGKEAWNQLKEIHQPSGPARKVMLFKKLLHLSMPEGGIMSSHVNEFSSIVDQLAEIKIDINEEMLAIILLSSLPKSYEGFIVAIESRDTVPALTSLKVKLLEEGTRQQELSSNNNCEGEQLNVVRSRGHRSNRNQQQDKHANERRKTNNNSAHDKKCYNCGRRGHFAAQCRSPKIEKSGEFNCFVSLAALEDKLNNNNSLWCVDSGASSHFFFDKNLFVKYEKC